MDAYRNLLLGFALPLFVAPFAACEEDSNTDDGTTTGPGTGGTGGDPTSNGGNPTPGSGGNAGMGGQGGDGGSDTCGNNVPLAGELCFDPPDTIDTGGIPTALAIGQWDGGAGVDILHGVMAEIFYSAGNGMGTFAAAVEINVPDIDPSVVDMAVGQLDNGANLDVVVGDVSVPGPQANLGFGNGAGTLNDDDNMQLGEGILHDIHIADIAGSPGSQDVFQVWSTQSVITMTSGTEDGGAYEQDVETIDDSMQNGTLATTGTATTSAVWASGDTPELSWSTLTANATTLIVNAASTVTLEAAGHRMVAADLTGDGNDEIVVIVTGAKINVLVSDGDSAWVSQGANAYLSLATGAGPQDIAAGDLDGDGDIDIAVTCQTLEVVDVFINDGAGGLTRESIALANGAAPTRLAVGDLNADDVADIVVATSVPDDITILLSNP